jgi:DNA-binding response OmpR family regulator
LQPLRTARVGQPGRADHPAPAPPAGHAARPDRTARVGRAVLAGQAVPSPRTAQSVQVGRWEPAGNGPQPPVVVCIAQRPEERSRLAGQFDGVGVLVIASDPAMATAFLERLQAGEPVTADPGPDRRQDQVRVGDLRLNLAHHEATWHGRPLRLTSYELKVLGCLADRPGRVWTYRQLHDHAWDGSYFTGPAAVQSVIKRLRAKLRGAGASLQIDAVRGLGFRLAEGNGPRSISAA